MKWSGLINLIKFLLGFALAIALLGLGGVVAARYLVTKLTAPPPRPAFANDKPLTNKAATVSKPAAGNAQSSQVSSTASAPVLEPGAYQARVVQPIGLILRDGPGRDSNQIGGIEFNSRVVVLEESSDKQWQRVRLENSDRAGWVKAGNTERSN
ncbi:SH3 domain-containing protein [Trichocoleus sp. FACHB-591]|uniref:SH3 domain-containing protein n=1 Tax=unclassified Trichocoleus TaxID=2628910 RepID=UPI001688B204|nr:MULTISPECIES: SH3 domain-containing protein [unclassified Trichocoleus]MBD2096940.1 SH3 domain-containing protein [Trichocoleus sp. FACHB-591]MBD2122144.1 SH3 domain-containing protein [Trichocoleus sp. FACHB-262]